MKQTTIIILIILTINYLCIAEELNTNDTIGTVSLDKRVSLYLHPLTLLPSVISSLDKTSGNELFYYATVEVPISLRSSLIIRPS